MSAPALRQKINGISPYIFGEQVVLQPPANRDAVPQRFSVFTSVFEGLFGRGQNSPDLQRDAQAVAAARGKDFYQYHIGDLFTPGTQNFVFEPTTELTPLTTIWGNAFLRRPNTFKATQPPQIYADFQKRLYGLGGLQAGQFATQPLESIGA